MEALSQKVNKRIFACDIFVSFGGNLFPSQNQGVMSFLNSKSIDTPWVRVYSSKSSIEFSESSSDGAAGTSYAQQLQLRFPSGDELRPARMRVLEKARYFAIKLTDGRYLVMGRNDSRQNTRPGIKFASNLERTSLTISQRSIHPAGFLVNELNNVVVDENIYYIDLVSNSLLSGAIDGSNTDFQTLSPFRTGTTRLFRNGQRLTLGTDYLEVGFTGIQFLFSPLASDIIIIDYQAL